MNLRKEVIIAINVQHGLKTHMELLRKALAKYELNLDHQSLDAVASGCLDLYKFIKGEANVPQG